jgi:putative hydrolase of the HAD superfamily
VLFDMYGTLLFEEGGLDFRYAEIARRAGLDVAAFMRARHLSTEKTITGAIADGVARARFILSDMGVEFGEADVRNLARTEETVRFPAVHLYPATKPTLRWLRRAGYQLGLISDCTYLWRRILQRMDLEPEFDVITLSCEMGVTKPHPRMYLDTCRALGVEPEECVFVGDGGSNELQGARSLGITAVLVDQEWGVGRQSDHHDHDFCINNLGELLDLLPVKASSK